jgi:hypothetical protein
LSLMTMKDTSKVKAKITAATAPRRGRDATPIVALTVL